MINGQAAVLTTLYYFPLVLLLVLIGTKAAIKCIAYYNNKRLAGETIVN